MSVLNSLNAFLESVLPHGCIGAVREVSPGDEDSLAATEVRGLEHAVVSVRRASGAGRVLARHMCARIGSPVSEIPRSPYRYPIWPSDVVGSISHDRDFVAVAVGPTTIIAGIGIDIEPAEDVSEEVAALVASHDELMAFSDIDFSAKAIFSIKEAVFKAVYPSDRVFLEFGDVIIDRTRSVAETVYGRSIHWRLLTAPRVLAVAWH